ncbi:hypothetical protein [Streptomyces decoyicus]
MVKFPQHGTYTGPLGHRLAVSRTIERIGPGMVPWNIFASQRTTTPGLGGVPGRALR